MFRLVAALVVCLLMAGCVATRPDDPNFIPERAAADCRQVYAAAKLVPDPNTGWTEMYGPVVTRRGDHATVAYAAFTRVAEGRTTYLVQVQGRFPKRVYLGDVYSAGARLKSRVVDRERIYCGYDCTTVETVEIEATQVEMEGWAANGLSLEVRGRRDSITAAIPATYLAAVLAFHRDHAGKPR